MIRCMYCNGVLAAKNQIVHIFYEQLPHSEEMRHQNEYTVSPIRLGDISSGWARIASMLAHLAG